MDKDKEQKDSYIVKSNFLISSKWRSTLSENKIIALSLTKIEELVEDPKTHILYSYLQVSEIREILGGNESSFYEQLKLIANTMSGRVIGMVNDEAKEFCFMPIFSRTRYANGQFEIGYNPAIGEHITALKSNFAKLNVPLLFSLQSNWSFRLYELLKSKAYNRGEEESNTFLITYSLAELKFDLGVANADEDKVRHYLQSKKNPDYEKALELSTEKKYERWEDFKNKVLEVAVKEINQSKHTNMHIEYEKERGGRGAKITKITFIVSYADEQSADNVPEIEDIKTPDIEKDDIFDDTMDLFAGLLKSREVHKLCEIANYDYNRIKEAYAVLKNQKNDVKNVMGFLTDAIRGKWESYEKDYKKSSFNKFKQNEYDFEQLEMELIGI